VKLPTDIELKAVLGSADVLWSGIVHAVEGMCVPIEQQWKPSKAEFGRMCLLRHKKRTLLYMTPDKEKVWIAIILGERAYGLAMTSSLPVTIKRLFSDAKPYAEGRGIRFPVSSLSEVAMITQLVRIKTTPK